MIATHRNARFPLRAARRRGAVLAEVPFRHRPISLFRHIEAFSQLSPLLKAPSLVLDDGTALVESSVILEYLASLHPALAELAPARAEAPIKAAHATGVALTVAEKAVQVHYERALRAPAERSESWGGPNRPPARDRPCRAR